MEKVANVVPQGGTAAMSEPISAIAMVTPHTLQLNLDFLGYFDSDPWKLAGLALVMLPVILWSIGPLVNAIISRKKDDNTKTPPKRKARP